MLDCGLDMASVLNFMPIPLVHSAKLSQLGRYTLKDRPELDGELRESSLQGRVFVDSQPEFGVPDVGVVDFADIDAILVSNYTTMLSLPYITEETGFRGDVFVTEPTLHFGRLFMEETIEFVERSSTTVQASKWKSAAKHLPPPLNQAAKNCKMWRKIYSRSQMEASLSKVTLVGFSEQKDVFGLVSVSPASSGFCIGSSNWVVSSGFERIAYVSGSSTLTTHPRPMDQSPLRNVDCLILTALTQTPTLNPDPMIGEFCKTVVDTTKLGGNVLVPCYPSGIVYDLLECLAGQMDLNGLTSIPLYFVSPVADSSLAYSNIMAEWLSVNKQNRVYLPEEPFPHGSLVKCGRLKSFRNLYDENFSTEFRQPCVMFCGHPSLRFGDAIHFLELWGGNSNNTIVFTEPSFPYLDALAPFQPLYMKAVNCPIDTSLNFNQAKKLIRDLKPGMIAVPEMYSVPPVSAPLRTDLCIDTEVPRYTFKRCESLKLPVKCKLERINIDPNLAAKLLPVEVRPGVAIATVTGNLVVTNNRYTLQERDDIRGSRSRSSSPSSKRQRRQRDSRSSTPTTNITKKARRPSGHVFGKLDVREFVQKLASRGFDDARVEEHSPGSYMIHLDKEETLIQVEDQQTHVVCDEGANKNRELIRDTLINCLNKF